MSEAKKVLFINQEMTPYSQESDMAKLCRELPQAIQERGREIRTFMPKWGTINERRNQLHEVIRLSGMNLIIDDTDHPLIIKVASIQAARMQVYFIDNDDYFQGRKMITDENGEEYSDNDSRVIFFGHGVLQTVLKLRWVPDVVHVQGWMGAVTPIYIKKAFRDEPSFANCKVVYSLYDNDLQNEYNNNFKQEVMLDGITEEDLEVLGDGPLTSESLQKLALHYSDGLIINSANVNENIVAYAREIGIPVLDYLEGDDHVDAVDKFYNEVYSAE